MYLIQYVPFSNETVIVYIGMNVDYFDDEPHIIVALLLMSVTYLLNNIDIINVTVSINRRCINYIAFKATVVSSYRVTNKDL